MICTFNCVKLVSPEKLKSWKLSVSIFQYGRCLGQVFVCVCILDCLPAILNRVYQVLNLRSIDLSVAEYFSNKSCVRLSCDKSNTQVETQKTNAFVRTNKTAQFTNVKLPAKSLHNFWVISFNIRFTSHPPGAATVCSIISTKIPKTLRETLKFMKLKRITKQLSFFVFFYR